MNFMNENLNPPRSNLIATSFIMSDERKKRVKFVVGGKSSRHVDDSGAAPDVEVHHTDQFLLISSFYKKLLLMKRR